MEVFPQQSKVLIKSRPFKVPNSLEVYHHHIKKERLKIARSIFLLEVDATFVVPMMFSKFTKVPSEGKLYQDHSSDTDDSNTSS